MPARYEQIASWINNNRWTKGAELGVFSGRTHFYLLDHCPDLSSLIGVDVWDTIPSFREGPTKSGEKCHCKYCDETRADRRAETVGQMHARVTADPRRADGRSTILLMPTVAAAELVDDGTLDFVFVDGDHSTEGVAGDIAAWRPKLRPGGWLIGHDWNLRSVREAVCKDPIDAVNVISKFDDHMWMLKC